MKITNEYIKSLIPCEDRHNNYLKHYKETSFSKEDFLKLENISYDDKIWVWKKFATINEAALFGLACASSVLYLFENQYPTDKRPRLALEAVEAFIKNPCEETRSAVESAAESAVESAAESAAWSAAWSARSAVESAAWSAGSAVAQQETNLMFLVEIYEQINKELKAEL